MLRPMGHVNDGGESLLRTPCLGTEASGTFAGGGVTRCGRGDLLSRCGCALRVRAMIARSCLSMKSTMVTSPPSILLFSIGVGCRVF